MIGIILSNALSILVTEHFSGLIIFAGIFEISDKYLAVMFYNEGKKIKNEKKPLLYSYRQPNRIGAARIVYFIGKSIITRKIRITDLDIFNIVYLYTVESVKLANFEFLT